MTGEEYFKRVTDILKDYGKTKMNHQDNFQGFIPVLIELDKNPNGLTAGDIAEKFHVSTARVATMLNSLEAKNYVIREKNPKDKRITIVLITENGKSFLEGFKQERILKIGEAIKDIPDSDMETYFNVTKILMKNLCKKENKDA